MSDAVAIVALVVTSALAVTAHLAIAAGLLRRSPRWRAPVALVLAPLAPWFAAREHMWLRAVVWVVGVIGYSIVHLIAYA